MASEGRFTVNLPPEARRVWDMLKRGHTHTRVAMAGLAAWASLDRTTQDELMMLVASVSEQGRPWSEVLDWADARREAQDAEDLLLAADEAVRQKETARKSQKNVAKAR